MIELHPNRELVQERGLRKLVTAKIARRVKGRQRNKIHFASEILAILEEPVRIDSYA